MIEGHGDDIFRFGNKIKINFSSNIPQNADHQGLLHYMAGLGDIFRNYPEPAPLSIEKLIAQSEGMTPENVIVTNGATEAIYLLAHLFSTKKSAIFIPTFREYQDACSLFSHQISFFSSLDSINESYDLVWLCNPNNPTGLTFDYKLLSDIIASYPKTLFVVDQAYGLYSVKKVLGIDDLKQYPNLILLQSFTKKFSVPGLRIGYAVGNENLINDLKKLRMPWSLNSFAIAAARYLLFNQETYTIDPLTLNHEAWKIINNLDEAGFNAGITDCNFFLAETPVLTAAELKQWLIENYGILIRDAANFEGLSPRHFRIAAQSPNENRQLEKALREWIALF